MDLNESHVLKPTMAVTLGPDVLFRTYRFSLYNSPFPAHDAGCAIDLYPEERTAPSPVAGEVVDTRTVRAPPKPYAVECDHLIVVETEEYLARLLHVEPTVEVGESVSVGDPLGCLVRSGFFAPWVPNHVHLGFREFGADPVRASGSLPIDVDVPLEGRTWDGTGTVVEAGETWARLDAPDHPAPGQCFVGLASQGGVLDGGFPHYDGGGLLADGDGAVLAGESIGTVSGRNVAWRDCTVFANDESVTGVALFCARDAFGVKLVGRDIDLAEGEFVELTVRP